MKGGKEGRWKRAASSYNNIRGSTIQRSPWMERGEARVGENSGGELSTTPGHKSTCTYRIASESFLYIPANVSSSFTRVYPLLLEIPRSVVDTNDYTYRLQRRSSSRISPIDLSNRSRVVPTPHYPSISLVWTDIFKMIPVDAGASSGENLGLPPSDNLPLRQRDWIHENNPCPFYQGILLHRDIYIYTYMKILVRRKRVEDEEEESRVRARGTGIGIESNRMGSRLALKFRQVVGSKEFFSPLAAAVPLSGWSSKRRIATLRSLCTGEQ